MKLKSLGILMALLLLMVSVIFSLSLVFVSNQFDIRMQSVKTTYAKIIVPLRQIDANTKNLRFHLYASFMHNPEQSVSPLHTHPLEAHTNSVRSEIAKNIKLWDEVEAASRDNASAELTELKTLYDSYFSKGIEPGIRAAESKDWTGIVKTVTATLPEYIVFEKTLQEKIDTLQAQEEQAYMHARTQQKNLLTALFVGVLLVLIGATVTVWKTVQNYTSRLTQAIHATEAMANGDLLLDLSTTGNSEASGMLRAMEKMQISMRHLVGTIRSSSDNIHASASEVALGNNNLSARTEQQAASLEETAATMEELTSAVTQNAGNASQANQLAESASMVAAKGGSVVSQVVETMDSINDSAKKIVDIITVIDGIAFQTNILALNAAVEAARAGEQGRGFAVVASEVRNLAQRSAGAAKEIKTLIGDSVEKINVGTKLVAQAGITMDEIVASVKSVTSIMSEIAAASHEQTSGIGQVNQSIIQMDSVTQQNAAMVEEAMAASMSLQEQAISLSQAISVFKFERGDSVQKHSNFEQEQVTSILHKSQIKRAKVVSKPAMMTYK
jgi:methyl-accepting chemotaxis protein